MTKKKTKDIKTTLLGWCKQYGLNVLLIVLCFVTLLAIRLHVDRFNTGDEPHYLLMAYSLEHDHDLNLYNNFKQMDYLSYYPAEIPPQGQIVNKQLAVGSEKWYSIHSVGLPVIMAPILMTTGRLGLTIFITLVATATVVLVYFWVRQTVNNRKIALLTSAILMSCYFFNTLVGYIYPDMLIACLGLVCLLIIHNKYDSKVYQALFGAIIGFLVFLHFKTLLFALPLIGLISYKYWRSDRKLPWFIALGGLPFAAYFMFTMYQWFGTFNPADIYAGLSLNDDTSPPAILSALLFDGNRGLLAFNPVMLLLFVGLPLWFRYERDTALSALVVVVPYALILTDFWGWFGGDAPAGRYVMDFLPWLMPAIAVVLLAAKAWWQKAVIGVLWLGTLLFSMVATYIKLSYVRSDGPSLLFVSIQRWTGIRLDAVLPLFTFKATLLDQQGKLWIGLGYCLIIGLFAYGYWLAYVKKIKLV
jgi:hypothetical protein